VSALRASAISSSPATLAIVMGWPDDPDRARRVAMTVVTDGLAKWEQATETIRLA
jgi:hypothetical protein